MRRTLREMDLLIRREMIRLALLFCVYSNLLAWDPRNLNGDVVRQPD